MKSNQVLELVLKQLENNFALTDSEAEAVSRVADRAYQRSIYSLTKIAERFHSKYYEPEINPFNTVVYCNYLYYLSHEAYVNGMVDAATKVYYLNKMLNCVELFYTIEMPDIWSCEHPLGSILGHAQYGNYFLFYQGCTVGGNRRLKPRPTGGGDMRNDLVIGENVIMYSNSKILGDSHIGDNCIISANCYIKDADIPANSLVFGQSPNLIIKPNRYR